MKEGATMIKKSLISALTIGVVIGSTTLHSNANEPNYTEDGELILDVQQEPYQDLSTPNLDEPSTEPVLDEPSEVILNEQEVILDEQEVILDEPVKEEKAEPVKPKFKERVASLFAPTATPADKVEGKLLKDSETFKVDVSNNIVIEGTRNIKSVSIAHDTGLIPASYTIAGKKLTFLKDKLNNSASGTYTFTVTFDNGDTAPFKLRVDAPMHPDDYWSANIKTFNINPSSNRYVDLEMVSAATELNVHYIEANDVKIPPSKYRVMGGTIVVDKAYLASLGVNEFIRFNIFYNKGQFADIILTIINETVSGGVISPEGC